MEEEAEPGALAAALRRRRGSCRRSSRRCRSAAGRAAPAVRPLSIARTQCSKSVPSCGRHARLAVRFVLRPARAAAPRGTARARRGRRCRRWCARSARRRTAARAGRRSSAMRRPRPLGSCHQCCTSPSTNCRPAARSRCARARSGRAQQQRHHVLQLIAEAERAAGLVVAGARPEPAAQCPDRAASGSSARRTSRPASAPGWRRACRPTTRRTRVQRGRGRVDACACRAISARASSRRRPGRAGTRAAASRRARASTRDVQRGARIEAGAESPVERRSTQRGRPRERAVAADERPAVAGRRARRLAGVRERDAAGELVVVGDCARASRRVAAS